MLDVAELVKEAKQAGVGFRKSDKGFQVGYSPENRHWEGKISLYRQEIEELLYPNGKVRMHTLSDLRTKYPELNPPVVDGLFREAETVNIIAAPKVGKSWCGYDLLLSILSGTSWLGRYKTTPGNVLLIDNELHPNLIASRIPKVVQAKGMFLDDYEHSVDIWPLRGKLKSLEELMPDFLEIEPGRYRVILLDAKYRFSTTGTSENDNTSEAHFYNLVDRIAAQTKAAIVMIHHSSKGSQSDKKVTDVGAGAGAQSRAADCHIVLREHEQDGVVVLDAAVRSFKPVEPLALRWEFPLWIPDDSIDVGQLKGLKTRTEERQAANDKAGIDQIVTALLEGPATARALRELTGFGKDRLQRLLDKMVFEGHLSTEEIKVRNNKCKQYQLTDL